MDKSDFKRPTKALPGTRTVCDVSTVLDTSRRDFTIVPRHTPLTRSAGVVLGFRSNKERFSIRLQSITISIHEDATGWWFITRSSTDTIP